MPLAFNAKASKGCTTLFSKRCRMARPSAPNLRLCSMCCTSLRHMIVVGQRGMGYFDRCVAWFLKYTHTQLHTHACTHTHTYTHMHVHTRNYTHMHVHTHTHTQTHTHIYLRPTMYMSPAADVQSVQGRLSKRAAIAPPSSPGCSISAPAF